MIYQHYLSNFHQKCFALRNEVECHFNDVDSDVILSYIDIKIHICIEDTYTQSQLSRNLGLVINFQTLIHDNCLHIYMYACLANELKIQ